MIYLTGYKNVLSDNLYYLKIYDMKENTSLKIVMSITY